MDAEFFSTLRNYFKKYLHFFDNNKNTEKVQRKQIFRFTEAFSSDILNKSQGVGINNEQSVKRY